MSRLKNFLRRNKQQDSSSADQDEIKEEKPVTSTRGFRRYIAIFSLYYPLGVFQRALDWSLDESETSTDGISSKTIVLSEKPFNKRFRYVALRTILQSIGLSIVFTAPISLPFIFDIFIPFSIDHLPFGIADFVRAIIQFFHELLSPFDFVIDVIPVFSNIFATYNPMYFYGSTIFLLNALGLTDVDFQTVTMDPNFEGNSMSEFFAASYLTKFATISDFITPFLIFMSSTIAFFLVFRRARSVIFEIQGEKEEVKNVTKFKRTLLGYYLDQGYTEISYSKDRVADSKNLRRIGWLSKWGPLFAFIIPILLALGFVFL